MNSEENKKKFVFYSNLLKKKKKSLQKNIEDVISNLQGSKVPDHKKYLEIEISGETLDGVDAITPTVVIKR